ncbi:hypothetical protein [Sporotomaculum syntrophicum]|uniref:hypothetical protein n=1 Tax=Sporotomaculum syntrophicum TaxID=182264 RepID=UPI001FAB8C34|nr:hypothetical protein [Sporotomaculum syntrophicum]
MLMYAALLFVKTDGAHVNPAVWAGRNALNIFVLHYLIYVYAKYAGLLGLFNKPLLGAGCFGSNGFLFTAKQMDGLAACRPPPQ